MRKSNCRRFGDSFKKLDQFPENVQFHIRDGQTDFKTKVGAFFSIVMTLSVFAFGLKRWVEMMQFVDASIKVTSMKDFYDNSFHLDSRDHLSFAISLGDAYGSDIDGDMKPYGTFEF